MKEKLNQYFKIKERNSSFRTEIFAGITSFMTIAYILAVVPLNLSEVGMDRQSVFTATVVSSLIATFLVGVVGNFPFALAPSLGINSFFAFSIILGMGKSVEFAITASLISGILLLLMTIFKIRELLFDLIPASLKLSMVAGIGFFITFIGLKNAGIVESGGAVLTLGRLNQPSVYLALLGIVLLGILEYRKVKGSFIITILSVSVIGIFFGVTTLPEAVVSLPPSMEPTMFRFESIENILSVEMVISVFTFLFVVIFDTIGTLAGLASKADLLDENGKLQHINRSYLADSIGSIASSIFGTSMIGTTVESAAGIKEGGKTGLTALVTAIMLGLALLLSPIFLAIPSTATTPVLVLVGYSMMSVIQVLDFTDITEGLPAFLTVIMMPLSYSIADGIMVGILSYTFLKILTGKTKEVSIPMIVLSVLFILKIIFI
ncbi:NCS2 family permease [Gallicola sp. Sow4_E12]|uniref:NCS2 family permease n=1 Tax=Gallicola sp. Sow4_E12 TaxID=3438785 RepID=UPI003F923833